MWLCVCMKSQEGHEHVSACFALVVRMLTTGYCGAQLGDRPRLDANLGNFESFNEPFYGSYIKEDFGAAHCLPAGSRVARRSRTSRT